MLLGISFGAETFVSRFSTVSELQISYIDGAVVYFGSRFLQHVNNMEERIWKKPYTSIWTTERIGEESIDRKGSERPDENTEEVNLEKNNLRKIERSITKGKKQEELRLRQCKNRTT